MITLREYKQLKDEEDRLTKECASLQGQLKQVRNDIKEEFDCDSTEELSELEEKLQEQLAAIEEEYNLLKKECEEKHGSNLP